MKKDLFSESPAWLWDKPFSLLSGLAIEYSPEDGAYHSLLCRSFLDLSMLQNATSMASMPPKRVELRPFRSFLHMSAEWRPCIYTYMYTQLNIEQYILLLYMHVYAILGISSGACH